MSREALFQQNPKLYREAFFVEGVLTTFLTEGDSLVTTMGVGKTFGVLCSVNTGSGGWQKGPDGRWYYAHHTNLILTNLAKEYTGDSNRLHEIYQGSKERGLLPPNSTKDNVPIISGGKRTLFWMPDDAIQNAASKGCIPDVGVLGGAKPTPVSSGLVVYCAVNTGNGGWQKGQDGRWYYAHHEDLILESLSERYLGDKGSWPLIYNPSKAKGLLPPNSTPDDVPIFYGGERTLFWMPDEAILRAYNDKCIPEAGELTEKPEPPSCADGAKPTWVQGQSAWKCPAPCRDDQQRAPDGMTCVCKPGYVSSNPADPSAPCKPLGTTNPCPSGTIKQTDGSCKPVQPSNPCPAGTAKNTNGECVAASCPPGEELNLKGQCAPKKDNVDKPTSEKKESSWWPWLLGGAAVVAVGGYVMYTSSQRTGTGAPKKLPPGSPQGGASRYPSGPSTQSASRGGYPSGPSTQPMPTRASNPVDVSRPVYRYELMWDPRRTEFPVDGLRPEDVLDEVALDSGLMWARIRTNDTLDQLLRKTEDGVDVTQDGVELPLQIAQDRHKDQGKSSRLMDWSLSGGKVAKCCCTKASLNRMAIAGLLRKIFG